LSPELKTVDIILPIYNPKDGWDQDIIRQYTALQDRISEKFLSALIMVNDGSTINITSGIQKIKKALPQMKYVNLDSNHGKGYALRAGVKNSIAEYILYTDHDLPYTYGSMNEMLTILNDEDAKVVIGHRDEKYYEELPWLRVKISHYLKTINRFLLGLNTDDTQCGLKAFHHSVKQVFLDTKTNRFLIDIEFLKRLKKAKLEVKVIDVKSRDNVIMSTLGLRTILSELWSYTKILISS